MDGLESSRPVPDGTWSAPSLKPASPGGVSRLREVLGGLAQVDPVALPGALALAETRELLAARAQLDALLLRRLGDVDARKLHQLDASPTTTSWVRAQDSTVDASTITLARRLNRLPALDDAVQSGSLGPDAAARIASALTKLRPLVDRPDGLIDGQPGEATVTAVVVDGVADLVFQAMGGLAQDDPRVAELRDALSEVSCSPTGQLARLEAAFVLLAQHVPAGCLPGALSMLVDALLPNELEKRAAKAADQAQLTLRRNADGSGWLLRGELDLETGELAHTVLTAMAATDPDNPTDTSAAEQLRASGWAFGDPIPDDLPGTAQPWQAPRSRGRRMHDALKLALRAILDSGELGLRDKVAPHVGVHVGLGALHRDPGARPAVGASGLALPLSLVKKWWCDAYVTRYVLGLGHRVLETSHSSRTLKAHERRIKHLETGGHCQGAGCTRGPGCRLIPHHPDAWANCGTTSLGDTVLLCEPEHDALHRGQTIRLKDGRRLDQHGWVDEL
jgi:peptidoglycan hydrolase-like protein with peptidoglycan-binding domain